MTCLYDVLCRERKTDCLEQYFVPAKGREAWQLAVGEAASKSARAVWIACVDFKVYGLTVTLARAGRVPLPGEIINGEGSRPRSPSTDHRVLERPSLKPYRGHVCRACGCGSACACITEVIFNCSFVLRGEPSQTIARSLESCVKLYCKAAQVVYGTFYIRYKYGFTRHLSSMANVPHTFTAVHMRDMTTCTPLFGRFSLADTRHGS